MARNLRSLDLNTLQELYNKENRELEHSLLTGATWKDVEHIRKELSELSLEIYRKIYSNPAEGPVRNNP